MNEEIKEIKLHKDKIKWEKRAKKIYQFYVDFLAQKGRSPTLEEIGNKFGFSRARAGQIMARLEREGYVIKIRKYHRPYLPNPIVAFGKRKKL